MTQFIFKLRQDSPPSSFKSFFYGLDVKVEGATVSFKDTFNQPIELLLKALTLGKGGVLQDLIDKGLDPNCFLERVSPHTKKIERIHLLSVAIWAGCSKSCLNVLLKNGANPNLKGSNAWHMMTANNVIGTLKFVSNFYPYTDIVNDQGETPLLCFSRYNSQVNIQKKFEVFLWLLKNGANPNFKNNDEHFLNGIASFNKNSLNMVAWIKAGLNYGLDPNILAQGKKSLINLFGEKPKVLRTLLEAGADPFINDSMGEKAIYFAFHQDDLKAGELLWDKGVDMKQIPNVWDKLGPTWGKNYQKWMVKWDQHNLDRVLSKPEISFKKTKFI